MNTYIGIDPGGKSTFGWCVIEANSGSELSVLASGVCSEPSQALEAVSVSIGIQPKGAGIDSPLYWVMSKERVSDRKIRKIVQMGGGHSATVGHVNSLRGACLVQGVLTAVMLRSKWPNIRITESHPKALLVAHPALLELLQSQHFTTEHERDAFIGAYSAWYSETNPGEWKNWVKEEEEELYFPSGFEVSYWFPGK